MAKDIFDVFEDMRLSWDIKNRCLEPLVCVEEDDREIIITVDLPYVKKQDISVHVTEHALEIKAVMEKAYKFHRWGTVQRGIEFNSFWRVIELPGNIIPGKAEAEFSRGVLKVRLPKRAYKRGLKLL